MLLSLRFIEDIISSHCRKAFQEYSRFRIRVLGQQYHRLIEGSKILCRAVLRLVKDIQQTIPGRRRKINQQPHGIAIQPRVQPCAFQPDLVEDTLKTKACFKTIFSLAPRKAGLFRSLFRCVHRPVRRISCAVLRLKTRVISGTETKVLMIDHGPVILIFKQRNLKSITTSGTAETLKVRYRIAHVRIAFLPHPRTCRIQLFNNVIQLLPQISGIVALVSTAIKRLRYISAEMLDQGTQITGWVLRSPGHVRHMRVDFIVPSMCPIRYLRLNQDAEFIGRLKVFRQFDMRMMTHEIKTKILGY